MRGDTNIPALAALLSDPSRCRVVLALADGRALPASALAEEAGVAPSTASEHLGKLLDADLLAVDVRGRHRYYRLMGPRVAQLLETLMQHSPQQPIRSLRDGTRAHALRQARYCYDHLAGRLGVSLMDAMLDRGVLIRLDREADSTNPAGDRSSASAGHDVEYRLSKKGAEWIRDFGIDLDTIRTGRRPMIRHCFDWSEQRHHLAGALGQAIAERLFAQRWLVPGKQGRVVTITESGVAALRAQFGIELDQGSRRPSATHPPLQGRSGVTGARTAR
jgi:DNA-binding transcriptional ArsR family regulator